MRRLLPLIFLSCALYGADLSGKWTGTVEFKTSDGESRSRSAFALLKQEADAITGKIGPTEDEAQPISNAKFDGKKLTFEITTPDGSVVRLALNLVDENKLDGTLEMERDSGEKAGGSMVLQRK